MRIPGTLKALYEQLEASPAPVARVTIPTENGPFVLEFAGPGIQPAARPAPRVMDRKPDTAQPPEENVQRTPNPKIRDTKLLHQAPPVFHFGEEAA